MWKESDSKILVQAHTKENPDKNIMTNAAVELNV